MTKTHRKEKRITITHNISVDACIAEEIKRLNECGVVTLSSCCGHGDAGYIVVADKDIQKMILFKYEPTSMRYLDNDIMGDKIVLCSFKPKSGCSCGVCQECYPHPVHEPGKCEYCLCGREEE